LIYFDAKNERRASVKILAAFSRESSLVSALPMNANKQQIEHKRFNLYPS